MTPDDLKTLRKELSCTARELANTIGVDQETVLGWEQGALFPTKRLIERMEEVRREGPSAIVRRARRGGTAMELLADPSLWAVVRKLLVHDELRKEVIKLAERYEDPKDKD